MQCPWTLDTLQLSPSSLQPILWVLCSQYRVLSPFVRVYTDGDICLEQKNNLSASLSYPGYLHLLTQHVTPGQGCGSTALS